MDKIKLIMITGFLGSGKTSLLNQLVALCKDRKIGVIINEFGKIGIDGHLIQGAAGEISEINNGSIFCSCLQGSFVDALIRYAALPIEYLFVESSGMADPSNLEELLQVVQKQTNKRYDHDRSICVVDGQRFLSLAPVLPALEKQVRFSHVLLVNKCDLMAQGEIAAIKETLLAMNPTADLLFTIQCRIKDDFLQMTPGVRQLPEPANTCNLVDNRPKTIILRTTETCTKEKLIEFLSSISQSVYRAKGFVHCTEGWMLVNVAGEQVEVQASRRHEVDSSTLVFISSIGPSIIRELTHQWQEYMGIPMTLRQ